MENQRLLISLSVFLLIVNSFRVNTGSLNVHDKNDGKLIISNNEKCSCLNGEIKRSSFPNRFVFGAAGSAYQYEGAYNIDGKGFSNWDYFTHTFPEKMMDLSNGDVATNSYHLYKEDVSISQQIGLDAYRFSISWSRILPDGRTVNTKGIEYYNKLIDDLILRGIEPYVTIFHWDVPLVLEERYNGFLNKMIIKDFVLFADTCFSHFGDRVKKWITLNEPWSVCNNGYTIGTFAPGRGSDRGSCIAGNSATEPYIVAHHQLLAHAHAVQLYREYYQDNQNGIIGITLGSHWFLPYSNSTADQMARERALDFMLGWFMDPLISGHYPQIMEILVKERMPLIGPFEKRLMMGSFDFIGINYYTTYYVKDATLINPGATLSYTTDSQTTLTSTGEDGKPIGPQAAGVDWLYIYPKGFYRLLDFIRTKYHNPPIIITENGVCEASNATQTLEEALNDTVREDYLNDHLCCLLDVIRDGANVSGYFVWSLLDNFEWSFGYRARFGLNYVDYNSQQRYLKNSGIWYKSMLSM